MTTCSKALAFLRAFSLAAYLMLLIAMGIKAVVAGKPAAKKQEILTN